MKLSRITLDELTLEQKVGQLFTFYHLQPYFSDFAEKAVRDWQAGGLFLDMESLIDPVQVREMTDAMQRAARETESGIPLFIAADFVAGAGCKLRDGGAVHFPKNKAVGAAGDASLAYDSGRITALESLELGVNFNYSPVVDINNNPLNPVIGTHSFGEDAALVTEMGRAVIRGMQEHGMIATAKHFPGHGDTRVDSHHDLPVLAFSRERLEGFELAPFRGVIEAGVEAVMVGHIAVPAFDPSGMPASLSQAMTTGILREELGFGGLIVTDGLSMKGVTSRFSQAEACVLALKAGADVLLAHALTAEEAREMVDRVLAAVRGGEIAQARIDEAAARVLKLKEKYIYAAAGERNAAGGQAALLHPDSERVSLAIARKALRDHGGFGRLLGSAAGTAAPERGTQPNRRPMTLGAVEPLGGPPSGDASPGERPAVRPGVHSVASVVPAASDVSGRGRGSVLEGAGENRRIFADSPWVLLCDVQLGLFADELAKTGAVRQVEALASFRELPEKLRAFEHGRTHAVLVALTHNKPLQPEDLAPLQAAAEQAGMTVGLVHFGSGYDLEQLCGIPALLLYDKAPSLQIAAAEFILAQLEKERTINHV